MPSSPPKPGGRPLTPRAGNSSPSLLPLPPTSTSSAVRQSSNSLSSRGGSPHDISALPKSHKNVTARLDLAIPINSLGLAGAHNAGFDHASFEESGVDVGYHGDLISERPVSFDDAVDEDEQAQRDYLSGPSDDLVIPLRRPSPLSRPFDSLTPSALPSPAISLTSTPGLTPLPSPPLNLRFPLPLALDSTPSRPRPRAFTLSHSAFGSFGTFPSTARSGPLPAPTISSRVRLFWLQLFANAASAGFLILIVVWALSARGIGAGMKWVRGMKRDGRRREWEDDENRRRYEGEKVVKDIRYYARNCGFDVEEQEVETKDGYLLKVFKVVCLRKEGRVHSDGRRGFPVLIQHGLFQSCGSFITSEERSLAFWLAEHGDYQVYLGNNRGVFDMGHVRLKRSDPRFWDYNIKELALYDLPAMVDHIRRQTGYDKIAFIGHSQGNATMFCSLAQGMVPELGEKLSVFIALAPAVFAGPLTTGFPFGTLKSMKWKTWRRWFGVLDFIPLMRISYNLTPSKPFGLLGYQMFAFLFNWTDTNWLLRRKPKKFRFTPSPVSSASIFWWTGYNGFSSRGCVLDPTVAKWFDHRFPPLSIHHGGKDFLVLTEPLLERLKTHETDVNVIRVQKLEEGEHCDFFWHIDAVELCFHSFIEDIERTRPRYPEEEDEYSDEDEVVVRNGAVGKLVDI